MVVNDDAYPLGNRDVLETFASRLAPTGAVRSSCLSAESEQPATISLRQIR
jgi:hypothetical protein